MIRVGIVGMGFGRSMHLPVCIEHPDFDVVALADSGSGSAIAAVNELSLRGVRCFSSGTDLVADPDIDAVIISAPADCQYDTVSRAISCGKHILCEKPVGMSIQEAQLLSKQSQNEPCVTAVCFEYRYDEVFNHLFELVRSGWLSGSVVKLEVCWHTSSSLNTERPWSWKCDEARAGGVLFDWAPHVIDYVRLVCRGQEIGRLTSRKWTEIQERLDADGERKHVSAPDNCFINGTVGEDCRLSVSISTTKPGRAKHEISVYGSERFLKLTHLAPFGAADFELVGYEKDGSMHIMHELERSDAADTRRNAVRCLIDDFATAIVSGNRPVMLPTFEDALLVWQSLGYDR